MDFFGCTGTPSLLSLKHLWRALMKTDFWKSTRKHSFDYIVPVELLGGRKQEKQEYTFSQGQGTYLMWHGAQPPKPTMKRHLMTYLWSPLFPRHLCTVGLFFDNIREEWKTKNFNLSVSLWNFLSNFQNKHSQTKEKSAFLKQMFHLCPSENQHEGKGLVCYLYSNILSLLLTWCVSQQPLRCTYLTPSLHFKAPHPWLPTTSVANLT